MKRVSYDTDLESLEKVRNIDTYLSKTPTNNKTPEDESSTDTSSLKNKIQQCPPMLYNITPSKEKQAIVDVIEKFKKLNFSGDTYLPRIKKHKYKRHAIKDKCYKRETAAEEFKNTYENPPRLKKKQKYICKNCSRYLMDTPMLCFHNDLPLTNINSKENKSINVNIFNGKSVLPPKNMRHLSAQSRLNLEAELWKDKTGILRASKETQTSPMPSSNSIIINLYNHKDGPHYLSLIYQRKRILHIAANPAGVTKQAIEESVKKFEENLERKGTSKETGMEIKPFRSIRSSAIVNENLQIMSKKCKSVC